jgi:phosphoribosylglycinamide formyltransferase-1
VTRIGKIGVLVSGRGSNLAAILEARLPVAVAISNRANVPALAIAERHGVRAIVLRRSAFGGDADARDGAIGAALTDAGVTLAVLAGYDQRLRSSYFEVFRGRTLNIHPSLLPRHGGAGMMGLAVHAAVLAAGDAETGVTIHEVTPELDAGPIVAQASVPVVPGETSEELAARVLEVEHRLLVSTLADLAAKG